MKRVTSSWFGDHIAEVTEAVEIARYGRPLGIYVPHGTIEEAARLHERKSRTEADVAQSELAREIGSEWPGTSTPSFSTRDLERMRRQRTSEVLNKVNRGRKT